MCKISVIIPVYNAQKYIKQCLDSLIKQDFDSYEIICVDDNSDDLTRDILKAYALQYKKIKLVLSPVKNGAAFSRNLGLDIAVGEFVIFLDADDFFSSNILSSLYSEITKSNADVVLFNCEKINMKNSEHEKLPCISENYIQYIDDTFEYRSVRNDIPLYALVAVPWNRFLRRQFLIENNIYFQRLRCCNDAYFSDMTIFLANKIQVLNNNNPYVFYRIETGAQISSNRDAINFYKAIVKDKSELMRRNLWEVYKKQVIYKFIYILNNELERCSIDNRKIFWKYLKESIEKDFDESDTELNDGGFGKYILKEFKINGDKSRVWQIRLDYLRTVFENGEKLIRFFKENNNVVVWGLGEWGKVLYLFMDNLKIHADYYVDINCENIDSSFYGHIEIRKSLKSDEKKITVLATNTNISQYLKSDASYNMHKIVSLNDIFDN